MNVRVPKLKACTIAIKRMGLSVAISIGWNDRLSLCACQQMHFIIENREFIYTRHSQENALGGCAARKLLKCVSLVTHVNRTGVNK